MRVAGRCGANVARVRLRLRSRHGRASERARCLEDVPESAARADGEHVRGLRTRARREDRACERASRQLGLRCPVDEPAAHSGRADAELRLTSPPDASTGAAEPEHGEVVTAVDVSAVRARLADHPRRVCRAVPGVASSARAAVAEGVEGTFDRRGAYECRDWHFSAGDEYTIVAIHRPAWNAHVARFRQHSMVFMYVDEAADKGAHSSSRFLVQQGQLGSACQRLRDGAGQWAMYDGRWRLYNGSARF